MSELCDCGRPLHYNDSAVASAVHALVSELGPLVDVVVDEEVYKVSRHYIALHGLVAEEVPDLALRYGW